MYNGKSKISASLALITALLLIGFMILLPFLLHNISEDVGIAAFFIVLLSLLGDIAIYASAIPFAIVALVFGLKMLKEQSREMLISLNIRMLITTCVLLPFLAAGVISSIGTISESRFGVFPIVYTVIVTLSYVACLIAQVVTIIVLKKSPVKPAQTDSE